MINIKDKGSNGEREACLLLNTILSRVLSELDLPYPTIPVFKRNLNQTAIGGSDIENPFGLCIEVKRQEIINIDSWWTQCVKASKSFGGKPIVLYRQNGKRQWKAVMECSLSLCNGDLFIPVRCEINHNDFCEFIRQWIMLKIKDGMSFQSYNSIE